MTGRSLSITEILDLFKSRLHSFDEKVLSIHYIAEPLNKMLCHRFNHIFT